MPYCRSHSHSFPNKHPYVFLTDIPEKAREAPVYGPPQSARQKQPTESLLASTTTNAVTILRAPSTSTAKTLFNSKPTTDQPRPEIVPPSRHLTPPARQLIEPPSRHLTPPLPPAAIPATLQKKSISSSLPQPDQQASRQRRPSDDIVARQPSQFGLRMKHKMRFSRSVADITSVLDSMLPHSIQEEFPLKFDHDFVVRLVEKQIRSRRSISGSAGDNHHHQHHHDHHEEDRGCTILGIHYDLGEVVGKLG